MPELPEVDAIAGVARKYAAGNSIERIEIVRWNGKYFASPEGPFMMGSIPVSDVGRLGKQVVFSLDRGYFVVHNAMTGYFDWKHEPWTFDYVEGPREATEDDVRVRFHFEDGRVLRFHDTRLFGSMRTHLKLPESPPELLITPNVIAGRKIMTLEEFHKGLQVRTAVKVRLMDQSFVGGIGNIYSVEACHAAGIHPRMASSSLSAGEVSVLHSAILWSLSNCIPQVRYDWLKVYRQASCGTCGHPVTRIKLGGRATFLCERCQPG